MTPRPNLRVFELSGGVVVVVNDDDLSPSEVGR